MAGISSLGVGSGLDLATLVESLVAAERAPTENRLNTQQSRTKTELSALGTLKSAVDGLAGAVEALKDYETKVKAGTSDEETVAVTTDGTADPGFYQIKVLELASAQSLASDTFADVDAALGEGTLTLTVGEETVEIDLTADANTLSDVRDAINASDAGVNAVIVRDGDAHRLLLTSAESGVANEMTLTVDGTVDPRLASAQMTETAVARDASFSVNGLALTASGNSVEDVIPGVTLTLKAQTEGEEAVSITVEPDRDGAKGKLDAILSSYNTLIGRIHDLGRASEEAAGRGPLVGDSTLRSLESQLRIAFSSTLEIPAEDLEGGEIPFASLLALGVSTDVDGKATLDAEVFADALETDEAGVEAALSAFATSFGGVIDSYTGSDGLISARTDGLNADLERIGDQREALDRRMEQVEARLREQFTALDQMVAQFNQTSQFLSGQLAGLAGIRL